MTRNAKFAFYFKDRWWRLQLIQRVSRLCCRHIQTVLVVEVERRALASSNKDDLAALLSLSLHIVQTTLDILLLFLLSERSLFSKGETEGKHLISKEVSLLFLVVFPNDFLHWKRPLLLHHNNTDVIAVHNSILIVFFRFNAVPILVRPVVLC